nr:MAG TPA: hypothetical protein [Caudoviricetes sp.]
MYFRRLYTSSVCGSKNSSELFLRIHAGKAIKNIIVYSDSDFQRIGGIVGFFIFTGKIREHSNRQGCGAHFFRKYNIVYYHTRSHPFVGRQSHYIRNK